MMEIVWTLQAQTDLRDLGKHFESTSSIYAESLVNAIYAAVGRLSLSPMSGKVLRQNRSLRQIAIGNYRAIYAVRKRVVTMLAIAPCDFDE